MPFLLRPATLADAHATAELLNAIIARGDLTSMGEPLSVESQAEYLRSFPDLDLFVLAEDTATGRLAGLQSLEPYRPGEPPLAHVGEISSFVADGFRGQGIGSLLMDHLLQAAQRKGYRKVMALIRADNLGAQAFYARHGFRPVGTLEAHTLYRDRFLDQVLCERKLMTGDGIVDSMRTHRAGPKPKRSSHLDAQAGPSKQEQRPQRAGQDPPPPAADPPSSF